MTAKVDVTTLDPGRYAETFAVFLSRSLEYSAIADRLCLLARDLPADFSCLDIGAGTGKLMQDWLSRRGGEPGRYVAIEPNRDHVAALRKTASDFGSDVAVEVATFDPQYPIPGRFDLILLSHSLYWMSDPVACVRHALRALNPGGKLVAILQGPFGIYSLYRLFNPYFERNCLPGPDHGLSSVELVSGLRDHGIDAAVDYDPTPMDLTGLFDPGNETERDDYLSFCLQIEFGRLREPWKSDVIAYMTAACIDRDGRVLWPEPNATVWLGRS